MYLKIMPSWGLCNPKIWPNTRVTMETIVGSVLTPPPQKWIPLKWGVPTRYCAILGEGKSIRFLHSISAFMFRCVCFDLLNIGYCISRPHWKSENANIFFWKTDFFFVRVTLCYKVKCDMDFNTWFVLRESNVNW